MPGIETFGSGGFGENGWDIDIEGNLVPKVPGVTLNQTSPLSEFATPQGGQLINTPDSSRGTPFRYSPSAVQAEPAPTGNPLTTTPSSRTGAPAPGIRTLPNQATMPGWVPPAASALTGGGLWG